MVRKEGDDLKLLIVGDLHLRGQNPRSRKGDYLKDCFEKLNEVANIARNNNAEIIQVGDMFDSPGASYSVTGELADCFIKNSITPFVIAGNHDIFGHNLTTLDRTPLGLLFTLGIVERVNSLVGFGMDMFECIGRDFDHTLDTDYSEYINLPFSDTSTVKILVIHGMLLPESPGFDMKHSTIEKVSQVTNADVIISGHYHLPFIKRVNGKLFINPGAVMRMSATESEIGRMPHVVLLDTDGLIDPNYTPDIIPLKCAKPGEEVLDRSHIEINEARNESMEKFISSLEATGESKFLNIQQIIEDIAIKEGVDKDIIDAALERLAAAREKVIG